MIGKTNTGGSGGKIDIVNGVIEQYYAYTDTIDTSTFIEFVNISSSVNAGGTKNISASGEWYTISPTKNAAIKMGENRVLFIYTSNSSSSNYAVALTFSGTEITVGTSVSLGGNSYYDDIVALSDSRALYMSLNLSGYLVGKFVDISTNMTLTITTVNSIDTSHTYSGSIRMINWGNNVLLIGLYRQSSSRIYTVAAMLNISNNSISINYYTQLGSSNGGVANIIRINDSLFTYVSINDSTSQICVTTAEFSGTSFSYGTSKWLATKSPNVACVKGEVLIHDNVLLVSHGVTASSYSYYNCITPFIITDINTITTGTTLNLTSNICYGILNTIKKINESNIIMYCMEAYGDIDYLTIYIVSVDSAGTLTMIYNSQPLNSGSSSYKLYSFDMCILDTSRLFIGSVYVNSSSLNGYVRGNVLTYSLPTVKIKSSESNINGVTKTKATTSTKGDVYVLAN